MKTYQVKMGAKHLCAAKRLITQKE